MGVFETENKNFSGKVAEKAKAIERKKIGQKVNKSIAGKFRIYWAMKLMIDEGGRDGGIEGGRDGGKGERGERRKGENEGEERGRK